MFLWRFLSSIILLIIFLCAFLVKGYLGLIIFTLVGLILSVLCVREFSKLLLKIDLKVFPVVTEAFAVLFLFGCNFRKNSLFNH